MTPNMNVFRVIGAVWCNVGRKNLKCIETYALAEMKYGKLRRIDNNLMGQSRQSASRSVAKNWTHTYIVDLNKLVVYADSPHRVILANVTTRGGETLAVEVFELLKQEYRKFSKTFVTFPICKFNH